MPQCVKIQAGEQSLVVSKQQVYKETIFLQNAKEATYTFTDFTGKVVVLFIFF